MDVSQTHIEVRRPWRSGEAVFLLGPGGVGKSTLGRDLAQRLGWRLVDLDLEFCTRLATIGDFIADHGYQRYRAENLTLARLLVGTNTGPMIFVTASGFLAAPPDSDDHRSARFLVETGYSVTLLPSLDINVATEIVVARQLTRGFGFRRETEIAKFRQRFPMYRHVGDALVISTRPPPEIAAGVAQATGLVAP